MSKYFLICIFYFIIGVYTVYSKNFIINVEGLEKKLYDNVKDELNSITKDEIIINNYFYSRLEKIIKDGLKPLGYYDSKIKFNYLKNNYPVISILTIKVILGKPILLKQVNIKLEGEVKNDFDFKKIIAKYVPKIGEIQNDGDYDFLKNKFSKLAISKGYFDAVMKKSQLYISLNNHSSYWNFNFDSGKRYKFGKISYKSSQIHKDYLNNITTFKYKDYYSSEKIAEFHNRLLETNWFSFVNVIPVISNIKKFNSYDIPIEVVVTPKSKNFIELGVGYSTDVGPRFKVTWNKPWINSYGQNLTSSISIAKHEQLLDTFLKIPLKVNPLEQFYIIQTGLKRINLNNMQSDTVTFNISRNLNFSNGWHYSLYTRWMLSNFIQANISNKTMLIYLGSNISRIRQHGGVMPIWGDSQSYSIDYSNNIWKSDVDFFVLQTKHVLIRTPIYRHRFVICSNLGLILTNNFEKIPLDLRFFAEGDWKIRGYDYQKNSLEDNYGKLTGASKLLFVSAEYQYNFINSWWGAVFIDIGEAVNNIEINKFKIGTGIGIRLVSPVGPIKFDFAKSINNLINDKIQFYVSLGAEL
ncbi:Translocation and assembly module subunit TamA [Candidatus Providencia siddallii]|uniref:Translocation and assembly module subunit TamA n=2 Tax=Candidatus Providencia siddallii TaxID=1715285 RepID=A0ABM9NPC6_9GAMM